ncbi:MAG TPA: hypothetical protein PL017_08780 [Tenuifilaceae bacterium]|nr:hypothetical protein [Tenuifilaceae bacterium]HPE18496.1 hypothetical protein [Tenuifilaceae bacterium]HPJ46178.1 hypothetical protein [Tenuifilaceae bacterium]HPQ34773.1 hypothetical protein [Tenuifilaceae bacterium]
MRELMNKLLEALKARVIENLNSIRVNENEIRQILTEPLSGIRSQKLSERYALSKKILKENEDNLKIQNLIVDFFSKYRNVPDFNKEISELKTLEKGINSFQQGGFNLNQIFSNFNEAEKEDKNPQNSEIEQDSTIETSNTFDILNDTITGRIEYDKNHPMFGNVRFFEKLLNFYIQREEYEVCAKLVKENES